MRIVLLLLVVTGLLAAASTMQKGAGKRQEVIPCPSEWKGIRAEYSGKATQDAYMTFTHTPATGNCVWVFAKARNEVVVNHHWAQYHLKPNAMPAEFDFRDRKGIYAFAGDQLKVCFAAPGKPR